ncbi:hypothetical protein B0H15DRAFT_1027253 [Mycena belliarum]|uniref:Uncharacterized protein n=1 Tax=Mycena belliarum TaxID=1033014 RepID=A0AAD6TTV7_9AGAR|nr:hypothetical protein B0H15DRAFT_1027253 [Mycena belliae]
MLKVFWFTMDNTPPSTFSVPVPHFPYFHPKDDLSIRTVVGEPNCRTYAVLDLIKHNQHAVDAAQDWVVTSAAVKVKADTILCFRSLSVTVCTGGPLTQYIPTINKRRLTNPDTNAGPPYKLLHTKYESLC